MIETALLKLSEVSRIFCSTTGHIPVRLVPLTNPRILWLNRRAMRHDPQFSQAGNEAAYEQHLLRSCAFSIIANTEGGSDGEEGLIAIADRYGGAGIGRNGGSGRAVVVNGYHVKGVGRTPLVSPLADRAHNSGCAYLEECVREVMFSELVDAEFPFGAVPVLAIIETGVLQTWISGDGPRLERQCLLVRPAFIRPAHFARAIEYYSGNPKEGYLDALRVSSTIKASVEFFGREQVVATWRQFWLRWAEQLGYAYVHRLDLSGNSESNIAWDGKLLDFGAMTALPSWARISTIQGGNPSGMGMRSLVQAFTTILPFVARYVDETLAAAEQVSALLAQASDRYKKTVIREVLRALGFTRLQSSCLLRSPLANNTASAVSRLVAYFAREQFSIFDGIPEPRIHWDCDRFWSDKPPAHMHEMRAVFSEAIAQGVFACESTSSMQYGLAALSKFRTQTRYDLFRDRIKPNLYPELDGSFPGNSLTQAVVDQIINSWVVRNRRDCRVEPTRAVPIGVSRGGRSGYMLFRCLNTERLFAIEEWHADGDDLRTPGPIFVNRITDDLVEFSDAYTLPAIGYVHLFDELGASPSVKINLAS